MTHEVTVERKSEENRVEIADATTSPSAGSENEEAVVTGKTWVVIGVS
jgi:hypothetical protein